MDNLLVEAITGMAGDEAPVARLAEPVKKDGRHPLSDGVLDEGIPRMVREWRELFLVKPIFSDKGQENWMHRWDGQHDAARSWRIAACTAGNLSKESGTINRRTGIWVTRRWRKSNSRVSIR